MLAARVTANLGFQVLGIGQQRLHLREDALSHVGQLDPAPGAVEQSRAARALQRIQLAAQHRGLFEDPVFVARFTELQLDTADLGAAYAGFAEMAKRGEPIPATISMLKIWSTETYERLALLLIESADEYGGLRDHCRTDEIDLHVVAPLFNALGAKIFAGSNKIQRNILAKQVLGLPA